jgi:hypothetical protein
MDKRVLELFLEGVMAFETELSLGIRFQLEFILRKYNRANQK